MTYTKNFGRNARCPIHGTHSAKYCPDETVKAILAGKPLPSKPTPTEAASPGFTGEPAAAEP